MGTTPSGADSTGKSAEDLQASAKLELYKLEYERAAVRYEDIYKAVWQIFSYMTAVSGGIVAFGGNHLQSTFLASLACAPLVYWFWGTYIPLDHYGNEVIKRLRAIEEQLNKDYHVDLKHYRTFDDRKKKRHLRVCHVAWPVFLVISGIFAIQTCRTISVCRAGIPLIAQTATEVKIVTIDTKELEKLIEGAKGAGQTTTTQTPPATQKTN